jgi:hypothetical protein
MLVCIKGISWHLPESICVSHKIHQSLVSVINIVGPFEKFMD